MIFIEKGSRPTKNPDSLERWMVNMAKSNWTHFLKIHVLDNFIATVRDCPKAQIQKIQNLRFAASKAQV